MKPELLTAKPQALFFQALANPVRMSILHLLCEKGSLSVSEICGELGLEQTHASHNLRCLAFCGLIRVNPNGRERIYSTNGQTVAHLFQIVDKHLEKYAHNLLTCEVLER